MNVKGIEMITCLNTVDLNRFLEILENMVAFQYVDEPNRWYIGSDSVYWEWIPALEHWGIVNPSQDLNSVVTSCLQILNSMGL